MKKIKLVVVSALLVGFSIPPAASVLTFIPTPRSMEERGLWDLYKLNEITNPNLTRVMFGYNPVPNYNDDFSWLADNEQKTSLRAFQVLLSPCSSSTGINPDFQACIEEVLVRKTGSTNWNAASLSSQTLGEPTRTWTKYKYFEVGKAVELDVDGLRPAGDRASIWKMPTARHAKGDSYLIRVALSGRITPPTEKKFVPANKFSMGILPISSTKTGNTINQDEFMVEEFPKGYEYKIRVRLGVFAKSIGGWLVGRIQNQIVDLNVAKGYLEITGTPAIVPMGVTNVISKSDIPQRILGICAKMYESVPGGVKTAASLSFWNIKNNWSGYDEDPNCAIESGIIGGNSFSGMVSSNATLYQPAPPIWDDTSKAFTFKVAAPHFDEFGKANKGFYTLYLPLARAKCKWGNDASLPQAQVQIFNLNGTSTVSTAVATQENGMLRFNISGFTYSAPTIRIRMGQDQFKREIKAPTKALTSTKKRVIICAKGKNLQQIIAVKPKCPTGYKKK